jgi:glycosyltransferase involved in cell wall biosynthesis
MSSGIKKIFMINIGFILEDASWLGGVNYYRNLFSAITNLKNNEVKITLFTGKDTSQSILNEFHDIKIVRSSFLDYRSPLAVLRKSLKKLLFGRDILLRIILYANNIQILSHSGSIFLPGNLKTIAWIPDFQHIHLPSFFCKKEIYRRNKIYKEWLSKCDIVIFSSASAKKDSEIFDKNYYKNSRILHFLPEISLNQESKFALISSKYDIPQSFFYVPNQFWAHKNHIVIIEALKILKSRDIEIVVIMTGAMDDNRSREHIASIKAKSIEYNLQKNFKMLGVVPYEIVIELIRNCQAVINPSFFEGWSSSVEEAKALGKITILSDIEVHREQDPPLGFYFDPSSPQELADAIYSVNSSKTYNQVSNSNLVSTYKQDRIKFANTYLNIVKEIS